MNIGHIDVVVSLMVLACSLLLVCCAMSIGDDKNTDVEAAFLILFLALSTTGLIVVSVCFFVPLPEYGFPDFTGAEVARMKVIHK